MDTFVQLGTGITIMASLILSGFLTKENFSSIPSETAMPKNDENPESGSSIFMNFYKKKGADYKLFEYLQKLKLYNYIPIWNGLYKSDTSRDLNMSRKLSPVILVPGLGATPIFAKWDKNSSLSVKTLDDTGNFEKGDVWSCNQSQNSWKDIWGPILSGLDSYCWAENIKVSIDNGSIIDSEGVNTSTDEFGSLEFISEDYMSTLIEALVAKGYKNGDNLFGAGYDFRKIGSKSEIDNWCYRLTNLIERSCSEQGQPATIIAHDLGSVITNYFLVNAKKEWKDIHIKSFISICGTFGGTPKALRAVLSGSNGSKVFNDAAKTFSGLCLMLPDSNIYGNNPLIHLNGVSYTSHDIPKLLKDDSEELINMYKLCKDVREKSMKAPGVQVFILGGDGVNTESSYNYKKSLSDNPQKNYPYYQLDLPSSQRFNYPDYFIGDGTMPKFAQEYPIFWSKTQKEPIYFQFFEDAEHVDILSMYEPIKYLLDVI